MMGPHIPSLLIAGLGNLPYPLTRHSVGQLIVDALAVRLGIRLSKNPSGYIGHGVVDLAGKQASLTLFKSRFPMNVSGPSIASIYRKTVTSPRSFIIVTDSLQHQVGKLSVKLGGSANGHNGVKNVVAALGGETDFYRFRIGIGRDGGDAATYVLGKLSSHECRFWANDGLDIILSELENVVHKGFT